MEETGQSDKEVLAAEEGSREFCLALEERLGRAGEERDPDGEGVNAVASVAGIPCIELA